MSLKLTRRVFTTSEGTRNKTGPPFPTPPLSTSSLMQVWETDPKMDGSSQPHGEDGSQTGGQGWALLPKCPLSAVGGPFLPEPLVSREEGRKKMDWG